MNLIYVDMDDVLCDFSTAWQEAKRTDPSRKFPQSKPGFFLSLAPMVDAIESVNELRSRFDIYVLTAPSIQNPHCYTEKRLWIEEYFGIDFTRKLIISPNKSLLRGDCLIDDHASGRGQENFQGTFLHFGSAEYPDWKTVMSFFDNR